MKMAGVGQAARRGGVNWLACVYQGRLFSSFKSTRQHAETSRRIVLLWFAKFVTGGREEEV